MAYSNEISAHIIQALTSVLPPTENAADIYSTRRRELEDELAPKHPGVDEIELGNLVTDSIILELRNQHDGFGPALDELERPFTEGLEDITKDVTGETNNPR